MDKLFLDDYSFGYSGSEKVLSHISLEINPGDFVCLCGPNGAGKSTLLRALSQSHSEKTSKERARNISFLTQNENPLWDYTVFDTVLSGRFCYTGKLGNYSKNDYNLTEKLINEFGLQELSEKSVHEISGGEFQKVRLARCFAQGSRFLLLDEPLASLDFVAAESFMKLLKEKCTEGGKSIIVSIHDINTAARFADKAVLLGKNRDGIQPVFQGTVHEVFTEENLSAVYGTKVRVWKHPDLGVPQI